MKYYMYNIHCIPKSEIGGHYFNKTRVKANTFMRTLSHEQRTKMSHAMKIREYPRDIPIIKEGDNGQEMFILDRGSILVTKGTGYPENDR